MRIIADVSIYLHTDPTRYKPVAPTGADFAALGAYLTAVGPAIMLGIDVTIGAFQITVTTIERSDPP